MTKTILLIGGEPDFSESLNLTGGKEDRSNENKLVNLAMGSGSATGIRLLDKLTDISILVIPGWSRMSDAGPSRTSAVISSPLWAGRQCMTAAPGLARERSRLLIWNLRKARSRSESAR